MISPRFLIILLLILCSPALFAIDNEKNDVTHIENITIHSLNNEELSIRDYREGLPLYLKFWASWCIPCQQQMPHFQQAYETYHEKIKILAINIDINDNVEDIKAVIRRNSLTMPMAIDESGLLANAVGLIGTPLNVLFDAQGKIVFKGHETSALLDNTLLRLSKGEKITTLQEDDKTHKSENALFPENNTLNILFFTATWCDDYLKESRPNMSKNCINAPKLVNTLHNNFPQKNWTGIISRLWTGNKEVEQFKNKYDIEYTLVLDESNNIFTQYNIKNFPTLILLKNGNEVFRTINFNNPDKVKIDISKYLVDNNISGKVQ